MSTTTLRIIQLIESLPLREQEVVRDFLGSGEIPAPTESKARVSINWEAEEGLADDDPFFKIMEEIERERQCHQRQVAMPMS